MTGGARNTTGRIRRALVPTILGLACQLAAAGCAGGGAATAPLQAAPPRAAAPGPAAETAAGKLMHSIRRSIELAGGPDWGEILIAMDRLRNHSHAPPAEFGAMRRRLAALLSGAAGDARVPIRVVGSADEPVDYELGGTAYLITAGGFDQWELYLTLRPEGRSWTIWRADGPVRMMRLPRGGEPQLYVP